MARKAPSFKTVRSYLLLLAGLLVIGYEVVFEHTERPTVIVAALLMMGISVPLNLDERLKWVASLTTKPDPPATAPDPAPAPAKTPADTEGKA